MPRMFEVSLFSKWPRGTGRLWLINPYLRIGHFELCIDNQGFLVLTASRAFGYIRKAGWHHARIDGPHGDAL